MQENGGEKATVGVVTVDGRSDEVDPFRDPWVAPGIFDDGINLLFGTPISRTLNPFAEENDSTATKRHTCERI